MHNYDSITFRQDNDTSNYSNGKMQFQKGFHYIRFFVGNKWAKLSFKLEAIVTGVSICCRGFGLIRKTFSCVRTRCLLIKEFRMDTIQSLIILMSRSGGK